MSSPSSLPTTTAPEAPPQTTTTEELQPPLAMEQTPSKQKSVVTLPPELKNFSFADKEWLILATETDDKPKPHEVARVCTVAKYITIKDDEGNVTYSVELDKLNGKQLRLLAANFGIKGAGSDRKFHVRQQLALRKITNQSFYISSVNIDINSDSTTKAYIRLNNAAFHPANLEGLLTINDRKEAKDFEKGFGGTHERWYQELNEFLLDLSNVQINDFLTLTKEDELYDKYVADATE
jgi:hypothetical protein